MKIQLNFIIFRKISENLVILVNLRNNFLIFNHKVLNILILVSGNSETCNMNNFTFWVTENVVAVL